ncbi:MAG TPA: hypothetical protein VGX26_09085 [Solirubrobacteraceae bacterium]|nr:hypothetical protein [Solirubrobacteraceae bacterium]
MRNSNRVAAFLSWHFEDPDIKPPRAKAGRGGSGSVWIKQCCDLFEAPDVIGYVSSHRRCTHGELCSEDASGERRL